MRLRTSSAEAKRLFAEQTDELNRRSRIEGPDPDAATELAEILAENERECDALLRERPVAWSETRAGR